MASKEEFPSELLAKLNGEQKATLEQMMKEVESKKGENPQDRTHCTLRMFSYEEGATYFESHDWSGSVVGQYPPTIPPNKPDHPASVEFEHQGHGGISKAGVAYLADGRYWLVAWSVPANKMYLAVGPKAPIDWDAVEKKLDVSFGGSVVVDPDKGYVIAMGNVRDGVLSAAFYNL